MSNRRRSILRSIARNLFRSWLNSAPILKANAQKKGQRAIRFEPLEHRELMAGDFYQSTLSVGTSPNDSNPIVMASSSQGEGEAADDLVAFAKALNTAQVKFFGADWCPFCNEQKALFQDGAKYLRFTEVTNPDRTFNSVGVSEGIQTMPTWKFPNGTTVTGVQTLAQLSTLSGIAIPKSSTPSFDTIPSQTLLIGSPLHVPVDAYDPNGNPLTISVTSSNPTVVSAEVLNGNRSLVLSTEGRGDMVFELFESEASRATNRIIQLAQSGFFNKTTTNQIIFHRVIDNFVIQAGDPTGTGSGGSSLGDFDDQFDVDLQHNRTGILSYAKAGDDTNDSQFFVTEGPQRNLDFNHSVFGQLVEGDSVREGISRVPVSSSGNKPTTNVVINSASVINDVENGMIRLKAVGGQTGTAVITVTVLDSEGNSTQQSFTVTVAADNKNSAPFLNDITVPSVSAGTAASIQLTSQDVEGDAVYYDATVPSGSQYAVNVDHTTGLVTLTPNSGFSGAMTATVGVRAATSADTVDTFDTQTITVNQAPAAPTAIDLQSASDSGSSNTDNTTNAGSLTFVVSGTLSGALVELRNADTVVGSATATGTTTTITTNNVSALGAGTYSLVATQTVSGTRSSNSPTLQLIYDNVQPVALATGLIPSTGNAGTAISVDLSHAEEANGLTYSIQNQPTGMTINATTGLLQWTPSSTQIGAEVFDVVLTDKAGNTRSQAFTITVGDLALGKFELRLVDASGNPITSASVNQTFKLQIYVQDISADANGVFAAFLDVLYNSALVEATATGTSAITHGTVYVNSQIGDTTTPGLINELGGFANSTTPLGEEKKLLGEVSLRTKGVGQVTFTSEPADGNGTQFLIFGNNQPIANSQLNFGSVSLAIGLNYIVANDSKSVNEDSTSNSLDVLLNDTINTGSNAVLTIQSVSTGSAGGVISIPTGGKSISYRPAANFNGSETFTYTVSNQDGATQTATVTVTVQPVNDPPVATNDTVEFTQDTTGNSILVLSNDNSGPDTGETLRVTAIGTRSQGGTATIGSSGNTIVYAPKPGFVGTETFSYTVSDGTLTSTATVTVTVKPSVPPPTAVSDSFTIVEDANVAEFDVLINDTPSQTGETLTVSAIVSAEAGAATVTGDNKKITYKPNANFAGVAKVLYTLRGSLGGTTTGTATFTVTGVNDAPTAVGDTISANSSDAVTVLNVLSNDTNVDSGETLTITSVVQPATGSGTVEISTDKKTLRYIPPNSQFSGTANFSYVLGDGSALTSTANVVVNVVSFVPRDIGGTIQLLGGAGNEELFANFELIGNTFQNQAVARSIDLNDGGFLAANLAPGTYTIQAPELPFFVHSQNQLVVQSQTSDGDSINNKLEVGYVAPLYYDVRDFMGRSVGHSLTVAVAPGKGQSWATTSGDWKDFKALNVALSSDSKQLTIAGTRSNNQQVRGTVPLTNNAIDLRGADGDVKLFKLRLKPSDVTFSPVAASTGSGEGEQNSVNQPSTLPSTMSGLAAEGEGELSNFFGSPATPVSNSITSTNVANSNDPFSSVDEAFRQILPNLQLISPAGDEIAESQSEGEDDDQERDDSLETVFDSIDELLDA